MVPLRLDSPTNITSLRLPSYAKINLGLRVLNKRSDGYHNIESIFVAIDLADTITIESSTTIDVRCIPEVTTSVEDNLVYKAAIMLSQKLTSTDPRSAKITVEKSIPTGAGLGGGSGNAAVTLLGLFEFWMGRPPSDAEIDELLFPIALSLGSDVPFFLRSGVSYVTGRGESVSPLSVELPWTFLVVLPGIHVNTAWAYEHLSLNNRQDLKGLDVLLETANGDVSALSSEFRNDFEPSVMEEYPVLQEIRQGLMSSGAGRVLMSGTGSTMFAVYNSRDEAVKAQREFTEWTTYICSPVSTLKPKQ